MKKTILIIASAFMMYSFANGQDAYTKQMQQQVKMLDNANTIKEYEQLAANFMRLAQAEKTQWLPYYYSAFCDAKVGWLKQDDPDNIEPFANKADEEIKQAQALIDTGKQKTELSELYCVLSMINRARVFINPSTYGRQYGPAASRYIRLAEKANPDNPRALYLDGWEKFSTPKMWGGDKLKAKELLETAKQKLDNNTVSGIEPHWGKKEVQDILNQLK
ncbi:MAG TPA: hypothetical protein VLI68_17555 [Hanamia sp.]|jgi:hypothetical protein|nr:hypothetical protein [Hanamia sp.]